MDETGNRKEKEDNGYVQYLLSRRSEVRISSDVIWFRWKMYIANLLYIQLKMKEKSLSIKKDHDGYRGQTNGL